MRALPHLRHRLAGLALTLLLLIASAAGGQAHRAPLSPQDVALQAQAQLWGLAAPALCAGAATGETPGPERCEACRLVPAVLAPSPDLPLLRRGPALPLTLAPPPLLRRASEARPAHAARAPPPAPSAS